MMEKRKKKNASTGLPWPSRLKLPVWDIPPRSVMFKPWKLVLLHRGPLQTRPHHRIQPEGPAHGDQEQEPLAWLFLQSMITARPTPRTKESKNRALPKRVDQLLAEEQQSRYQSFPRHPVFKQTASVATILSKWSCLSKTMLVDQSRPRSFFQSRPWARLIIFIIVILVFL